MKPILLFTVFLFAVLTSSGQNKFNELLLKMDKDLESFHEKFPQETIGLLTDKQEYLAGENILLSAFLSINGKASFLSKTIYVELGDYSGRILEKKMLAVDKSAAHAVIKISPAWLSGAYVINAYTMWMKNTPQLIAQKQVFILNKDYVEKPFTFSALNTSPLNVVFEPEGKNWAEGIAQNLIVSLADKNGIPVSVPFSISENGKEIAVSQTDKNGLAKLQLSPKKNAVYSLRSSGQQLPLSMPATEGISLSLNGENKTKLFANLQKSALTKGNQFLLVAIDGEKICYQSVFDFAEGATATAITKARLPQGAVRFLLFDENLQVVAERCYYNYLLPEWIHTDSQSAKLLVSTDTAAATGVLAVALPPAETVFGAFQNFTSLIPEIQNRFAVQLPDLSAASLQTVDALMQLQPAVFLGKPWGLSEYKLTYAVESGIVLRGNIKPFAGKPAAQGYKAEFMIKGEDSTTAYSTTQTLPNGDFAIGDLNFQQAARIFFQGNNKSNNKELLNMQLYPSYFDTLSKLTMAPHFMYEKQFTNRPPSLSLQNYFNQLASDSNYRSLETVIIKTKARSPFDSLKQAYLTPLFSDGNATVMKPEGHYISIWHFLRGRVPGLKVEGSLDNPSVAFNRYGGTLNPSNNSGEDLSESFGEQAGVLFFLNEVQVSKDVISTINADDVALVSVNAQPMPALGAYNGMIAIFTKKGSSAGSTVAKSMTLERRLGYANLTKSFVVDEQPYKSGSTLIYAPIYKPVRFSLPSANSYKIVFAGWDKKNQLRFETK